MTAAKFVLAAAAMLAGGLFAANAQAAGQGSAHDFEFRTIDGAPLPMNDFAGKAVLVVNTASECGFTPQYEQLQAVWQKYRDRGLVVLGVPSNDFGGQEPGTEAEIKDFCETAFSVDFPLTEKEVVKGDDPHPFYRWARDELGDLAAPKWNFHKYLVGPDGRLVDWFSTVTRPDSPKVLAAIEKTLPNKDQARAAQ
ncbi:Glutathione peroxidase [Caenispirillum salinarum AK4]|uniref:Glutathione peroxidase n=1 Tax=Caenispirillum salinarum AK4 TaxID=1238182 RepID=K9HMA1_9PROT|nr:glutathione peroxidase [Caenispirillum salinarum]EKV31478.1 Glutathione peroxidase [Caenispirillum salinarum AK4]